MIIINFKNYKYGKDALNLVRTIDIYCNKAIIAVPFTEIREMVKETTIPVYAQDVSFLEKGRGTGFIIPEEILSAGAKGSLLNHSENPISIAKIKKTIQRCDKLGIKLVVCAPTIKDVEKIKKLSPYAIAFEDPGLISTGKSITKYKTNDIKKFVQALKGTNIIPLCGAGITDAEDVKAALELGCKGVLVSSAVANSENPEKFLKEASSLF